MLQIILILFVSSAIKWNFTKFIADKSGVPVKRYAPTTEPFVRHSFKIPEQAGKGILLFHGFKILYDGVN